MKRVLYTLAEIWTVLYEQYAKRKSAVCGRVHRNESAFMSVHKLQYQQTTQIIYNVVPPSETLTEIVSSESLDPLEGSINPSNLTSLMT